MNGLLTRLVALVIVALTPAFALQFALEIYQRHAREREIYAEAQRLGALVNTEQVRTVEAARQVLTTWSAFATDLVNNTAACHAYAADLLTRFRQYRLLALTRPDGQVICGASTTEAGPELATWKLDPAPPAMVSNNLSDNPTMVAPLASMPRGGYAATTFPVSSELRFELPFAGADKQIAGQIVLGLSLDWLQAQFDKLQLPPDTILYLTNHGITLAHEPREAGYVGFLAPPFIRPFLTAPAPDVREGTDADGVARIYAYFPASTEPEGLALVVGLSRQLLMQDAVTAERRAALMLLIGAVLAVGGALLGANALVRRPFLRLLSAAERLREGDLSARANMGRNRSEFGRLGDMLDATAAALEAREGALRDALATAELTRRALAESETRLRLALDSAEVGVWEIDLRQSRVWLDHRLSELTRGLLPGNTWLALDDSRLRAWAEAIHPDDARMQQAAMRAMMQGEREHLAIEYRFRDAHGAWRWVTDRGAVVASDRRYRRPLRIVGVVRDITEQRDTAAALEQEVAERTAALAESERRFRSIFDAAFQFTALAAPDGTLLEANRALLEFCGRRPEAVLGRRLPAVLAGDAAPETAERLRRKVTRAAAGEFVRCELALPGANNREALVDFSLRPVVGADGTVAMLVVEARDITERARLQAQLAQAQKMEAVGQLTGGVAHDFNNLLQAVTGNLDLILRMAETRGETRLLRLVSNAQRAVARGARLTQQLLAFSRRQNLRPERVLVSRLIAETLELLGRAAGETVEVVTRKAPDLWPCSIDPAQFESALLNLAINARDAMPQGGKLTISAGNVTLSAAEAAALEVPPGDYVRVDVADTGTGIAPEHLPRIFEPFFTTKEVGKGSGLGLAMVHGFARQSGGAVSIASERGRGTMVSLFLPRDTQPVADKPAPENRGGEPPPVEAPARPIARDGATPSVLVVEDEPEVLDAVQFALVDAGYQVLTARESGEALEVLSSNQLHIDVLLCDVALPGPASGVEVADFARARHPGLRVLLTSGYAEETLPRWGRSGTDYEVLPKPFSQAELLRRIAALTTAATAEAD
jgi:PAS domain S-box-containing protein